MNKLIQRTLPLTQAIAVVLAILTSISAEASTGKTCPPFEVRAPRGNYFISGVQGDIRYSGSLSLDAYVQQNGNRRPSVVVVHGGEWSSGSRIAHVGQILEVLTRAGYNWFSLDYRLGGVTRVEDSLTDLRAALAFIRCHAVHTGIDPARLILLGEDSGAQLVALLAAERPAGVIGAVMSSRSKARRTGWKTGKDTLTGPTTNNA